MSIDLSVNCEGCDRAIELDGETYCADCWASTCAILPTIEKELRTLAGQLAGDAAQKCERLANHLYDMGFAPAH